jgi:SP family general alpha glucoside:H+ symporter-like MFS transporter
MGDAPKEYGGDVHVEKAISHVDDSAALDEKAQAALFKTAAMDAETAEHDMGVLQAVRAYPMAALWAFIMSCTIVRLLNLSPPSDCS